MARSTRSSCALSRTSSARSTASTATRSLTKLLKIQTTTDVSLLRHVIKATLEQNKGRFLPLAKVRELLHYVGMDIAKIIKKALPLCVFCALLHAPGSAQVASYLVYNLRALPGQQQDIVLTWSLPDYIQESGVTGFAVYRSPRPIYDAEEVNSLKPLAFVRNNMISYTDTVPDNAEYYYAVVSLVDAEEDEEIIEYEEIFEEEELLTDMGSIPSFSDQPEAVWVSYIILPGINATITGTRADFSPPQATATA